jgi:hypothetical protein
MDQTITAQQRLELLRVILDDGLITIEELREFCSLNFPPREGMQLIPIEHFIPDDTLQAFDWLCNWWILSEYPRELPKPNLLAFLWAIYVPLDSSGGPVTSKFMEFIAKGRAYCEANGLNPDQPMANDDTLRKTRNRARMAKARAGRRVPDREMPDPTLKAKVRTLEANIQRIKELAKVEDILCRDAVLDYQQKMIEAATERKAVAQRHKDIIDEVRNQIKALTQ